MARMLSGRLTKSGDPIEHNWGSTVRIEAMKTYYQNLLEMLDMARELHEQQPAKAQYWSAQIAKLQAEIARYESPCGV